MLPEITAEAVRFLSRRDLIRACGVSQWLDAMIAQCCDVFPLRPVHRVALLPSRNKFKLKVTVNEDEDSRTYHSLTNMNTLCTWLPLSYAIRASNALQVYYC